VKHRPNCIVEFGKFAAYVPLILRVVVENKMGVEMKMNKENNTLYHQKKHLPSQPRTSQDARGAEPQNKGLLPLIRFPHSTWYRTTNVL